MQFTREINRLLIGLLVAFAVVTVAAAYWAIVGPDTILQREDNPRLVLAESSIVRGTIVDRNGEPLVTSERSSSGTVTRSYLHPSTYSALGYYSLRYGVGGAEAAYNPILRGNDLALSPAEVTINKLMHHPQVGSDIRLTLDLDIQATVAAAMEGQTGAAVVLGVPDGNILALVSLPTYNPNTLDADWDQLRAEPGNPFFNRVIQGRYQPGGTLQTPLMAAGLLFGVPLTQTSAQATEPIVIDNLELGCAVRLPPLELSLRDAYAFACPQPFAALVESLGVEAIAATFDTFHLGDAPTVPGFLLSPPVESDGTPAPANTPVPLTDETVLQTALGQGSLTVSPLSMAMMAAAIVNDGNAPQPYLLAQTRPPDGAWTDVRSVRPSVPLTTTNVARRLQDLMRNAIAIGAAQNAGRPNIDIGGHAALAYSGDTSQAWFVGFATFGGRRGAAVAIVLEDSNDPGLAADIGGTALAAAQAAIVGEQE